MIGVSLHSSTTTTPSLQLAIKIVPSPLPLQPAPAPPLLVGELCLILKICPILDQRLDQGCTCNTPAPALLLLQHLSEELCPTFATGCQGCQLLLARYYAVLNIVQCMHCPWWCNQTQSDVLHKPLFLTLVHCHARVGWGLLMSSCSTVFDSSSWGS